MEAGFDQIQREEHFSRQVGRVEDEIEEQKMKSKGGKP
jgi:hypothetical protein